MRLFLILFAIAISILFISPRPFMSRDDGRALTMNPYLLRAMSGFARSVVGDFVWMKSRLVDELRYGDKVDFDTYMRVFSTQIILDPQFILPVRYASTYLASLPKRPDLAIELLNLSETLNRDRFDLLILEALVRVGYDVPNSSDRLFDIARRIEALPDQGDKKKLVGAMKMDDFMIILINYSRTKDGKAELVQDDLRELYCLTENADRREKIVQELEEVRAGVGLDFVKERDLPNCRAGVGG
ncbi:MAG: hypothetical protein LBU73_02105 [Helicobacteraceae bacterium]|jgi:hypothetical protein|nr:hypothetical protein [Helicobacteraceae bacterium]